MVKPNPIRGTVERPVLSRYGLGPAPGGSAKPEAAACEPNATMRSCRAARRGMGMRMDGRSASGLSQRGMGMRAGAPDRPHQPRTLMPAISRRRLRSRAAIARASASAAPCTGGRSALSCARGPPAEGGGLAIGEALPPAVAIVESAPAAAGRARVPSDAVPSDAVWYGCCDAVPSDAVWYGCCAHTPAALDAARTQARAQRRNQGGA